MDQNSKTIEEVPITKNLLKRQLVANILKAVDTLVPSEVKPVPENMIVILYNMKKKIIELDPNWEFNNPYNNYIFRLLILMDALNVNETFNLERHGKICHMLCRETRDIRRKNPLWKMDTSLIIEFINSAPIGKRDQIEEGIEKHPEDSVSGEN